MLKSFLTDHVGHAGNRPEARLVGLQGFALGEADGVQAGTEYGMAYSPYHTADRRFRWAMTVASHMVHCTCCAESANERK